MVGGRNAGAEFVRGTAWHGRRYNQWMRKWLILVFLCAGTLGNGVKAAALQQDETPRVIKKVEPVYPQTLLLYEDTEKVTVEFVVTESGEVRDPKVTEATHPDFVGPALEAIQKWRFKPGKKAGVAVSTRVSQQITFNLRRDGTASQLDETPSVIKTVDPEYPQTLLLY